MTRVFGFYNNKGGTGKSTLACCVSYQAAMAGNSTLLVDLDDQSDAAGWMLAGQMEKAEIKARYEYKTHTPNLSVVVVAQREDIPHLGSFDVVILDGRPTAVVGGAILGLADVLIMPYADRTGRKNARELATLAQCPVIYFMNQLAPPPSHRAGKKAATNRRLIGFDRALKGRRWEKAKRNLYREIRETYEGNSAKNGAASRGAR